MRQWSTKCDYILSQLNTFSQCDCYGVQLALGALIGPHGLPSTLVSCHGLNWIKHGKRGVARLHTGPSRMPPPSCASSPLRAGGPKNVCHRLSKPEHESLHDCASGVIRTWSSKWVGMGVKTFSCVKCWRAKKCEKTNRNFRTR